MYRRITFYNGMTTDFYDVQSIVFNIYSSRIYDVLFKNMSNAVVIALDEGED